MQDKLRLPQGSAIRQVGTSLLRLPCMWSIQLAVRGPAIQKQHGEMSNSMGESRAGQGDLEQNGKMSSSVGRSREQCGGQRRMKNEA